MGFLFLIDVHGIGQAIEKHADVKNPLPNHEPNEKAETEDFVCPVCGKSFNTKAYS